MLSRMFSFLLTTILLYCTSGPKTSEPITDNQSREESARPLRKEDTLSGDPFCIEATGFGLDSIQMSNALKKICISKLEQHPDEAYFDTSIMVEGYNEDFGSFRETTFQEMHFMLLLKYRYIL